MFYIKYSIKAQFLKFFRGFFVKIHVLLNKNAKIRFFKTKGLA
ncbi:Uncharacterised protein [Sphingobacterium multivorum]|nr:Uncharacterised protein [Sphingobacterium multivorum]